MLALASYAHGIAERYKSSFSSRHFLLSFFIGIFTLIAALIINSYAVGFATASASNPVTDLILDNIRVYDVDGFFVNGAVLMVLLMAIVCLWWPHRLPFTIKTLSLFIVVRSLFIILTHIGSFPTQAVIDPSTQNFISYIIGSKLYASFFLGKDSFFSGHTGLPFLFAMLYWDKKWLRYIFMALSVMFGCVVLLGHLHYTIDVLSAFFISYGTYRMARHFFASDLYSPNV
ncbi:MAG: phosphatase PAP2-related protein, partial [Candidatus Pacebacteria bacterium]|nr:phosphatase PAP2-related protein [Candidatus Paceibacterota bacterium]